MTVAIVEGSVSHYHTEEVNIMTAAGLLSSIAKNGFAQLVAFVTVAFTAYKYFWEIVEPNEIVVIIVFRRMWYKHHHMTWRRWVVLVLSIIVMVAPVPLVVIYGFTLWYCWLTIGVIGFFSLKRTITTWPATDIPRLAAPGPKPIIPGLLGYAKANVSEDTRTLSIIEQSDADGEQVEIDLSYTWHRGTRRVVELWKSRNHLSDIRATFSTAEIIELGQAVWEALFKVDNLENTLDNIVKWAARNAISETHGAANLTPEQAALLGAMIFDGINGIAPKSAGLKNLNEVQRPTDFGATIVRVSITRNGKPQDIAAAEKLAMAAHYATDTVTATLRTTQ